MKIILWLPFLILLSACSNTKDSHITAHELLNQIEQSPHPIIIDVRSEAEYNSGHIPHAIHIPFWQAFNTQHFAKNTPQSIILYCEHGPRAGIAKLAYTLSGFKSIRYLTGHMSAWRSENYPMER